jgi:hypothetical protein
VNIQWETQLLGMPVLDVDGRRLGRVGAAYWLPDPLRVVWFVVRLPGVRRRRRAVPAERAQWDTKAEIDLRVPYRHEQMLASPVVDEDSLGSASCRGEVEVFYAPQPAGAPR